MPWSASTVPTLTKSTGRQEEKLVLVVVVPSPDQLSEPYSGANSVSRSLIAEYSTALGALG